jgi:hypothetical protein
MQNSEKFLNTLNAIENSDKWIDYWLIVRPDMAPQNLIRG